MGDNLIKLIFINYKLQLLEDIYKDKDKLAKREICSTSQANKKRCATDV